MSTSSALLCGRHGRTLSSAAHHMNVRKLAGHAERTFMLESGTARPGRDGAGRLAQADVRDGHREARSQGHGHQVIRGRTSRAAGRRPRAPEPAPCSSGVTPGPSSGVRHEDIRSLAGQGLSAKNGRISTAGFTFGQARMARAPRGPRAAKVSSCRLQQRCWRVGAACRPCCCWGGGCCRSGVLRRVGHCGVGCCR